MVHIVECSYQIECDEHCSLSRLLRGSLVALEMRRPISVKREHSAEPKIPDVSTATGTNWKSATYWDYFSLIKSSAALDAEPGFIMVDDRLLFENESVRVASQANALPHWNRKDVTPSGLPPSPRSRPSGSRMERRFVVSGELLMMLLIAECRRNRPALKRHEGG